MIQTLKIPVPLKVPVKGTTNSILKEVQVEISIKIEEVKGYDMERFYCYLHDRYAQTYKYILPDFVYEALKGSTLGDGKKYIDIPDGHFKYRFSKTITSGHLQGLIKEVNNIFGDYYNSQNKVASEKMIFVYSDVKTGDLSSRWNSAKYGKKTVTDYRFFVGYRKPYKSDKEIKYTYYDIDMKYINHNQKEDIFEQYKQIPWTQDREDFYLDLLESFNQLQARLNAHGVFDINRVDILIESGVKLLGDNNG